MTTPGRVPNSTLTSYDYYDADRRLIESTDARDVPTYYRYASAGDVVTTTDALVHSSTTAYNGRNELVASIDADGGATSYGYEADGQQQSTTNADGFTATTTYDGGGWVSSATDDAGVTTESDQYDAAGNVTQQTDANGDVTAFSYDVDNRQTSMTNALGGVTTDAYNADGEMISSTDPLNRTTKWTYDGLGRETSTTDALGRTSSTAYNGVGEVVRRTDALGVSTLTSYDLDNRPVKTVTALGGTLESSSTSYNLAGEVVSTTDALGQVTTDSYNVDGEETGSKDPLGFGTSSVYDVVGQLVQSTDANGKVTNYSYDATGRQIGVLDPNNNLTQAVFDALGNEVQSIDARGKVTKTVYDADNRVLRVTDPNSHVSQSFYDKLGNLIESIDANGKASMTLYDALSRPFLSEDPNGHWTQTSYDGDGEVQASVDGAGDLTQYGYDGAGEQTSVRNGDGGITLYGYNAVGQTTSETDAVGNVTAYQLDGYGNLVATASPASGLTQSVYDANNRLVSTTDALNRKITYAYDNDGRLTTETWYNASGSVVNTKTYTYDHNGNMLTAGDNSGTYTMTYDNAGRLLTRKDPNNLTLTYGYDQNGNVTSVADSLGGSITNVYDLASQLTSVQFATSTVQARLDLAYTNDGQVSTLKRYKDTGGTQLVSQSAYSYDSTGNVTEIKHTNASGGTLGDYQYTFDGTNRLSSETDTENGGAPVTTPYSYDAASQLTQAGPNGYSYDLNGNRNMTGYGTGSGNQLTSDGTWNYTYDAVGNTHTKTNIATGETWTFTWNNANQLTQAVDKDKNGNTIQTVTLKYDVFGNLIEEDVYTQSTGLTVTTKYAYDASGNVWADLSSTGQLVMRRLFVDVNGQVQPFARIDASGNVAWYLTDHLGSVRLLTDNTATVIDQIDYDAWGNIPTGGETQPGNGDRFKFASGVWDANLGMYLFNQGGRGRWYMPWNGNWLSVDTMGLGAGPNPYDYVGNAPTDAIDPLGTQLRKLPEPPQPGDNGAGLIPTFQGTISRGEWGAFSVPIRWTGMVTPAHAMHGGAIVQHVQITFEVWGDDGKPIKNAKTATRDYWELWYVKNGKAISPEITLTKRQQLLFGTDFLPEGANLDAPWDDVYGWKGMQRTAGRMTIAGVAYYFPDRGVKGRDIGSIETLFPNQGAPEAGGLPSFPTQGNELKIRRLFDHTFAAWTTHVVQTTWGWKRGQFPTDTSQPGDIKAMEDFSEAGRATKVTLGAMILGANLAPDRSSISETRELQLVSDPNQFSKGYLRVRPITTFPASGAWGVRMPYYHRIRKD